MPYLTVQEYIRRYGAQETAQITNEVRATPGTAPAVVESKVEEAIEDASDVVDGFVGTRYALPLPEVPRLVTGWVAALAREFLFKTKPVPAVTEAADRVRLQLAQLSARKINLPVPEGGEAPTESSGGLAETSGDAPCPTFSSGQLSRYMGTFGRGCDIPAWRRGG